MTVEMEEKDRLGERPSISLSQRIRHLTAGLLPSIIVLFYPHPIPLCFFPCPSRHLYHPSRKKFIDT